MQNRIIIAAMQIPVIVVVVIQIYNNNNNNNNDNKWAAPCKNVSSDICGQRRPRSACASTQSDLYLRRQLTESLDTTECMN